MSHKIGNRIITRVFNILMNTKFSFVPTGTHLDYWLLRGLESLGYRVFVEKWGMGVMHIGWAIAGAVLLLFSAVAISAGTISLLMKRMETRLS